MYLHTTALKIANTSSIHVENMSLWIKIKALTTPVLESLLAYLSLKCMQEGAWSLHFHPDSRYLLKCDQIVEPQKYHLPP